MQFKVNIDELDYVKIKTGLTILIENDLKLLEAFNRQKPRKLDAIHALVLSFRYTLRVYNKLEIACNPDPDERQDYMESYRTVKSMIRHCSRDRYRHLTGRQ